MNDTLRVLVADDDEGLRQLMRMVLRREGFEMIEAMDDLEALARARDCDPTVILLEVMMSGMDGLDVCRNPKHDQRFDGVPVICVTAVGDIKNLSLNFTLAPTDDSASEIQQGEVIAGFLLPADEQTTKAIDP